MSRSPTVVFLYTTVQLKMIQVTKYESLESKTLIIWDIMMAEPQLGPTKKEVIYGYFVIHILGILKKSFTAGKIAVV